MREKLLMMTRVAGFLIVAGVSFPLSVGYAMTLSHMKALRGADLLELRVVEVFARCGLPDAVIDHGTKPTTQKDAHWNGVAMKLSDGHWDLLYGGGGGTETKELARGWNNPNPTSSDCFADGSRARLFTQGGAGILTIDRKRHKTTYAVPENPFKAHKVIGYEMSFVAPVPFLDVVRRYGKHYDTVQTNEHSRTVRYWVTVESSQMPVAVYAIDFEISNSDDTCVAYRVATGEYEFVRRKLEALTQAWERYGID